MNFGARQFEIRKYALSQAWKIGCSSSVLGFLVSTFALQSGKVAHFRKDFTTDYRISRMKPLPSESIPYPCNPVIRGSILLVCDRPRWTFPRQKQGHQKTSKKTVDKN